VKNAPAIMAIKSIVKSIAIYPPCEKLKLAGRKKSLREASLLGIVLAFSYYLSH
jgi:hypothetical protein